MRRLSLVLVAVCVIALVTAETVQAQVYFGRGPRGGTAVGVSTPGFGFSYGRGGWGGESWGVRLGQPYYGGGWYGGYPAYGRGYGAGWYGQPYYGGYYSSPMYGSYPSYGWTYSGSNWSYPSATYYSGSPYQVRTTTWDPGYPTSGTAGGYQSAYHDPQMHQQAPANQVLLRVQVPETSARVWVGDQQTQQMGTERVFISPPLEQGTYHYTVKASWMENGREVTRERTVKVEPGRQAVVNFMDGRRDTGTGAAEEAERPDRPRDRNLDRPTEDRIREDLNRTQQDLRRDQERFQENLPPAKGTDVAVPFTAKVVRVNNDQLVVTRADDGREQTFRIGNDVRIMRDGTKIQLSDLRPDTRLSITTRPGSPTTVTLIDVAKPTKD